MPLRCALSVTPFLAETAYAGPGAQHRGRAARARARHRAGAAAAAAARLGPPQLLCAGGAVHFCS